MSRVSNSTVRKNKHKKILSLSKGYRGRSKNCFKIAKRSVEKALQYSYRDRRNKKWTIDDFFNKRTAHG